MGKNHSVHCLRGGCSILLWPMKQGLVCAGDFWESFCFFFLVSLTLFFLPALPLVPRTTKLKHRLWMKPTTKYSREDTSKELGYLYHHLFPQSTHIETCCSLSFLFQAIINDLSFKPAGVSISVIASKSILADEG